VGETGGSPRSAFDMCLEKGGKAWNHIVDMGQSVRV
jgi:hypothetical protein